MPDNDLIERDLALQNLMKARLSVALYYAQGAWRVVPVHGIYEGVCTCSKGPACSAPGKHPWLSAWPTLATTDFDVIRGWWRRNRLSNVGVVTGAGSGIVVVDIDPRNGGADSLARLLNQYGEWPATPVQHSGGGGLHYFFSHPGWPVPNRSGDDALAPGVDVKGERGFIVMAPSMHVSGREYTWDADFYPDRVPPAPAPEWLLRLIRSRQPQRPSTDTPRRSIGAHSTEYARLLGGVPEGHRHAAAVKLAGHFLHLRLPPAEVEAILLGFARLCTPPMNTGDIHQIVEDFSKKNGTAPYTISVKVR